jgi:sugar fermentation stimulation protein A
MEFGSPLIRGKLVQRYKRFLADVHLDSGGMITATCPNTGSMIGLKEPGMAVWLSTSDSPTRKYKHTWEMVEADLGMGPTLVGINTSHPNRLVSEAIQAGGIPSLQGFAALRREVKYGRNSRIDILLEDPDKGACYVEVKNVHLSRRHGFAEFPDSVTERGAKHLVELADMVKAGHRAVMVYLIQRSDAESLSMAGDIDPGYVEALRVASLAGVEAIALRCRVTPTAIEVERDVPILLPTAKPLAPGPKARRRPVQGTG